MNAPVKMKKQLHVLGIRPYFLLFVLIFSLSCSEPERTNVSQESARVASTTPVHQTTSAAGKTGTTINIPNDAFTTAFQDRSGNIWFGTRKHGVYRYDGESFTNFSKENGFCSNGVSTIIEDKEGNVWFGTDDGLCNYDMAQVFNRIPIPQSDTSSSWLDQVYPIINPNSISCLLQDSVGNLWFGTYAGGAYRYDRSAFTPFLQKGGIIYDDSLHHNVIQSILEDRDGNIWFTSMSHGGVSRYDGTILKHLMPKDGLSDDMVRSSFQDKAGNIWFGTNGNRNGGLDRYDSNTEEFTNFNEPDGLCLYDDNGRCYNGVRYIHEDRTGTLWLGNGLGNLCTYDGKNFAQFTSKEGQHLNGILFILQDAEGKLWFGGRYGRLYRYDGETLTDFTHKTHC